MHDYSFHGISYPKAALDFIVVGKLHANGPLDPSTLTHHHRFNEERIAMVLAADFKGLQSVGKNEVSNIWQDLLQDTHPLHRRIWDKWDVPSSTDRVKMMAEKLEAKIFKSLAGPWWPLLENKSMAAIIVMSETDLGTGLGDDMPRIPNGRDVVKFYNIVAKPSLLDEGVPDIYPDMTYDELHALYNFLRDTQHATYHYFNTYDKAAPHKNLLKTVKRLSLEVNKTLEEYEKTRGHKQA